MEIFKTSERLYRRFLVFLFTIFMLFVTNTSHAGGKYAREPLENLNETRYRLDARVVYDYDSGHELETTGYKQEMYCTVHRDVNCRGGTGKDPKPYKNRNRDNLSRPIKELVLNRPQFHF